MNLPQILMESTFARIGITTEKAEQHIEQPRAELSIRQPPAELSIKRTPAKLTIDQTKAWEDMDLMHIFRRIEEFADDGYRGWLQGMARRSRQGDELMKIEHDGNPIAAQAKENSEDPMYEFNIGWIPSPFSVNIDYKPGTLDINWQQHKPMITATANKPVHNYTPGKVNVYLDQMHSLQIAVANSNLTGNVYEQKI